MAQASGTAIKAETEHRSRLGRCYWRMWWGNAISSTGDGAFVAALPLLAVAITKDPRLVSVVTAAMFLPWMGLSLPVGALVDRYDRATLMWRAQAGQAAVVAVLAILIVFGQAQIAVLAVAGFCLGSAEVVFSNAAQSVLPALVRPELLPKANGSQQISLTVGESFLGPPVGSLLFGYGFLLAVSAVGSVLGGLVCPLLTRRLGILPSLVIGGGMDAAVFVGIGLAPGPAVAAVMLAGQGFAVTMWNVVTISLRQRIVPSALLGRVNSVYRMLGWGLMPIGALAGGFVAHAAGLRAPYIVGGLLCGLSLLAALPFLLAAGRDPAAVQTPHQA
ncbi:MAG TPA: MFS transporter [Streptosporangiaceae bacterium]|nr:MFS transporter [Streptosporangiaceae bacterium]